jgi:hypothetical protein
MMQGNSLPLVGCNSHITPRTNSLSCPSLLRSAGIAGPAAAHAVVAGHACGFLLLVSLRVLTKAVLPDTSNGLRLSFCIYFGVTGGLVLAALAAYLKVIRPAVQAAIAEAAVEEKEQGDAVTAIVLLKGARDRCAAAGAVIALVEQVMKV